MKEMNVTSSVEQIKPVTDFINAQLSELKCPEESRLQIDVAIDEIFGNIIHYAYKPDNGPVTIRFSVEDDPLAVNITFIDHGIPFNPLKEASPDLSLPLRNRSIGGLGLFVVQNTMDEVSYHYVNDQNILTIRKIIAL